MLVRILAYMIGYILAHIVIKIFERATTHVKDCIKKE